MKKIIGVFLCIVLCMSLFGCAIQHPVKEEPVTAGESSIIFFETGDDADCSLLRYNGTSILIDTGEKPDGNKISRYLRQNNIDTLDCIIFSHFDKDHCGGALRILENITCKEIMHPAYVKDSPETKKLFKLVNKKNITDTVIEEKEEINLNGIILTLLPPEARTYKEKQSNNSSMVVKAVIDGVSALYAGDCQEERVDELLKADEDYRADILKLMYHGRPVENEAALIEKIKPAYTVITAESDENKVTDNVTALGVRLGAYYYSCENDVIFNIENGKIAPYQQGND